MNKKTSKSHTGDRKVKNLLLIVGMPGSGKSEAAKLFARLGYRMFEMGDIIREEVKRRNLRPTKNNINRIALWFHSKGRERILVSKLLRKISKIKTSKSFIVVDGPRSPQQLKLLKKQHKIKILAITLPDNIRWKRQMKRHRLDAGSLVDLKARDRREISFGVKKLIQSADYKISNNCSLKKFRKKIKRLANLPYLFKD